MQPPCQRSSWPCRRSYVSSAAFFIAFGLCVWLFIDPRLIYESFGVFEFFPAFIPGRPFLRQHLAYPGGPAEYLAALLSQAYCSSWVGAAVIALLAWGLWAGTRKLVSLAGEPRARFVGYVPALLVLAAVNRYENPLPTAVGLVAAIWLAVLYEKTARWHTAIRVSLYLAISAALYAAAAGASFVFAILAVIYEAFLRRRAFLAVTWAALGCAVPFLLATYIFNLVMPSDLVRTLPFHVRTALFTGALALLPYALVPVAVFLVGLWKLLSANWFADKRTGRPPGTHGRVLLPAAKTAAALMCGLLTIVLSYDGLMKNTLRVAYHARHETWPMVLEIARDLPPDQQRHPYIMYEVGRALYGTGRLGKEMFSFPQSPTGIFVRLGPDQVDWRCVKLSGLLLQLGGLNDAEKLAFEVLENLGDSPLILYRLATISLIKGQTETARILLRAQSKDLIYGAQAREALTRLEEDPDLLRDRRVQHLRSLMLRTDRAGHGFESPEAGLLALLDANRRNRMAFEYLMAYYLVSRQPRKLAANMSRLDDFGIEKMPRHYQEAIVLDQMMTGQKVDLQGRRIDKDTAKAFDRFDSLMRQFMDDRAEARRKLAPQFGRTYWFYHAFRESGVWE